MRLGNRVWRQISGMPMGFWCPPLYYNTYRMKYEVRATSHTRLKVHDHCISRSLIGQKKVKTIQVHFTLKSEWSKDSKKLSWMKTLHEFLHMRQWMMFWNMLEITSGLPPHVHIHSTYFSSNALMAIALCWT